MSKKLLEPGLPRGFEDSFGKSLIIDEVIKVANAGCLILGICNGFQILTETGLLKGTLLRNKNLEFTVRVSFVEIYNRCNLQIQANIRNRNKV